VQATADLIDIIGAMTTDAAMAITTMILILVSPS
jgi:hypothetical protein